MVYKLLVIYSFHEVLVGVEGIVSVEIYNELRPGHPHDRYY